jgi:hypothetical protein
MTARGEDVWEDSGFVELALGCRLEIMLAAMGLSRYYENKKFKRRQV